jgi:triacylglycerol lipase
VYPKILKEVQRLRTQLPWAAIKTTGHSLGGAQAQLTMMELKKSGFDVSMTNFGQPRVGDDNYATFSHQTVPY